MSRLAAGLFQMSFSLMGQNRKSCCPYERWNGSSLFWHHPDAQVALQPPTGTPKAPQSPILQGDMDKLREMDYNDKYKAKSLRPFTQLLEHTPETRNIDYLY
jgi:hypothetical protein